jgi:DNA-binding ferritin-like protein
MDIVKLDVPLFIRLLELAREDIKGDADIHDVAQRVIELSQDRPATMADYDDILDFMNKQGDPATEESVDELDRIKQLGGIR